MGGGDHLTDRRPLVDPLLPLVAVGVPSLALLAQAAPLAAAAALVVAAAVAFLTWTTTRRAGLALAAPGLALLFVPPEPVALLVVAGLVALIALHAATGIPYVLVLGAAGWFVPLAVGPWAAGVAVALLAAAPDGKLGRFRVALGLAVLLAAAGLFVAPLPALVGLLAGLAARAVVRHPGRARFAAALGRGGLWAALLPALLLFLLAALGRVPPLAPRPLLATGWAAVALGAGAAAAVLGSELALRATGAAPARAFAVPLAAFAVAAAAVATGELRAGARLAAFAWVLVAPAAAVGVARLAAASGRRAPLVGLAAAAVALAALPLRTLV